MAPRTRSGALTAGVILIVIGMIFLLENWAPWSAWRLSAEYWPVILIIVGLRKIYDYFTWREIPPLPGSPVVKE